MAMLFVFDAMVFYLPPKMGDDFKKAVEEINSCGFSMGRKVFVFDTQDAAQSFADRIGRLEGIDFKVSPVPSTSNSDDYNLGKGKFVVSFTGVKKPGKEGEKLTDFFQSSEESGKDYSRESRMETSYKGDALMTQEEEKRNAEDKEFALTGKEGFVSQKTKDVMQKTIADLYLAFRNVPTNKGSIEELEYVMRTALTQLAVKMGFSGDAALTDFLSSAQGGSFRAELEDAARSGKFFIQGSASSEWINNASDLKKQFGNALGRCQMALDVLNSCMREAGREELTVPFLPMVYLIAEPTEKIRTMLIDMGMGKFSEECSDQTALENARKTLEESYTDGKIAQNREIFANYIYKLSQDGDADAQHAWNMLTSGKNPALTYSIKEDENGNKTVDCQIGNVSRLNTLLSITLGVLRVKGGVIEQALSQGDARSASFALQENTTLGIEIVDKASQKFEAGKDAVIKLSVVQQYTDKDGEEKLAPFSGTVVAKAYDEAGNETVCGISPNKDGTYNATFTPQSGKKYSFVAYAYNTDNHGSVTIDSGRVKQTLIAAPKSVWAPFVSVTQPSIAQAGETMKFDFTSYRSLEGKAEPLDALLAFQVWKKGEPLPSYFMKPGKDKAKITSEYVCRVGEYDVVVDRSLTMGHKTYSKKELVGMVKSGVVAIRYTPRTGGKGVWTTLDGRHRLTFEEVADLVPSGSNPDVLLSKKKSYSKQDVVQVDSKPNEVLDLIANSEQRIYRTLQIAGAIPISQKTLIVGGEEYSASDLRGLAEQNIVAIIGLGKDEDGKAMTMIYGIDGRLLGPFNMLSNAKLRLPGFFLSYDDGKQQFSKTLRMPEIDGVSTVQGRIWASEPRGGEVEVK